MYSFKAGNTFYRMRVPFLTFFGYKMTVSPNLIGGARRSDKHLRL